MPLQRLRRLLLLLAVGACGKGETVPVTPPIVVASVTVAPDTVRLVTGTFAILLATVLGPDGQSLATPLTWESSNPTVATVTAFERTATVSAIAPGVTHVRASSRGRTGTAIVTVTPPQQQLIVQNTGDGNGSSTSSPPGIACGPGSCTWFFDYGTTVRLTASAGPASVMLSWGPPCTGTGECTVVMDQPRTITATFGKYPRPVGSITVSPPLLILEEGGKGTLTATIRDPEGNILTDRPFTWTSMFPAIATVSPSGEVTGMVEGDTVWVSATSERITGNGSVAVLAPEFRAVNISVGAEHTCAYRLLNAVHCWGNAGSGRLGNPANPGGGPRVHVVNGRRLFGTDGGEEHSCATIGSGGEVHCWGSGDHGQLGDGLQTDSPVPVRVNATEPLGFALGVGGSASCSTTTESALYCWGANPQGLLGVGSSQPTVNTPAAVVGGLRIRILDVGEGHICAITEDYLLYCWGQNAHGQLGTGDLLSRTAPVRITGIPTVRSVATGAHHTCVVGFTPSVWCWGLNDKGQLGDGTQISRTTPTLVNSPQSFGLVAAGKGHTCARTLLADTYCWGDNTLGQLGDGTTVSSNVPVRVATGLKFFSTKAGANHTCGVTVDQILRCWGSNLSGQLGLSGVTSSRIPIAVPRP